MIENSEYRAFINAGSEQYSEKYPIDVAVNLFKEIQAIYNGTYLVALGERVRMTKADAGSFVNASTRPKSSSVSVHKC